MSYKVAIASGKGGTGKTSVSVHLFHFFSSLFSTVLVDCDVEEPNDHLFINPLNFVNSEDEFVQVAHINTEKCTFCRKCVDYCEFNAITILPPIPYAKINSDLCHSCGACLVACKDQAITEVPSLIGKTKTSYSSNQSTLVEGQLKVGSPLQTALIRKLKKKAIQLNSHITLFDAPPGTSCPVVETISEMDYIILVTEPTPFGLHDLKLSVNLIKEMKIPFGIIINKSGIGFKDTHEYILSNQYDFLGEIPFSKEYAAIYSKGELLHNPPLEFLEIYQNIGVSLIEKLDKYERNNCS